MCWWCGCLIYFAYDGLLQVSGVVNSVCGERRNSGGPAVEAFVHGRCVDRAFRGPLFVS